MTTGLLSELIDPHAAKVHAAKERKLNFTSYLESEIATDTGKWSLNGHAALGEIVRLIDRVITRRETDSEITILAGEQIGKSTIALGLGTYLPAILGRNVGYFLPTQSFADVFGSTRLKRMVARSPMLAKMLRENARGSVNQKALKEFDGKYLYILGLESMMNALSIPLDALVNDEVDLLPEENLEWSQGRVAHSELRLTFNLSAGYTPGAGIDKKWQEGTQHKFLVKCVRCGKSDQCLEELFPECMLRIDGHWVRVCTGCHAELDLETNGRWVATHPSRARDRKYSYRISQLAVPAIAGNVIMKRWLEKALKKKSQLAKFRCAVLAMPDAGALQPVTDAELRRMEVPKLRMRRARGELPRYAGMDTGDTCHFYCYERTENGPRLVWIEEIDSDVAVDQASQLIGALGVEQLVIDKKPLTTVARALAYRFPRIVALQDFSDGDMKVVDEKHERNTYRCVKVHRDESIDDFTGEITDALHPLQIPEIESDQRMPVLASHLKNLRKDRTVDAKGRQLDKYVKGVANHYGMAGNSARLAELIAPVKHRFSFTPVEDAKSYRPDRWKGALLGG